MSRHWKPEIVTPDWTGATVHRRYGRRMAAVVLGGAVAAGLGAGFALSPHGNGSSGEPDSPIEWNAVQAVPRRTPDAADIEWEKRSRDPAVIASPEGAWQSSQAEAGSEGAGLPRGSAARNDGVRAMAAKIVVIDGDTFQVGGERVRIAGIDAPETHPPRCGQEAQLGLAATQKLRALLASGTVTMSGTVHDKYGRDVREVQVDGADVGEAMVSAGLARSYVGGRRQGWC